MLSLSALRWFPPLPLPKVPGASRAESDILRKFITTNPLSLTRIAYNCPLFNPVPMPAATPRTPTRYWHFATALRTDAIGFDGETFWIIEAKRSASPFALLQLQTYQSRLLSQFSDIVSVRLCLACDTAVGWMLAEAQRLDILVVTVG